MNHRFFQQFALLLACLLLAATWLACAEGEPEAPSINDNSDPSNHADPDAGPVADVDEDTAPDIDAADEGCTENQQCDAGQICARPAPGQQGQCADPQDDRLLGEACSDSAQCQSGLCYQGRCTDDCTDASDCPVDWSCEDATQAGYCVPPACSSDDDCPAGQSCAVTPDGTNSLEAVCLPDNAGGQSGDSCFDHGECQSRYCLDGVCSALCDDDPHCGDLQHCDMETISVDGAQGNFEHCLPTSITYCVSPDDCEDTDRTCNAPTFDSDGAVDGASCGLTNPGQASLGDSCASPTECESGLCLPADDGQIGECSVFCQDADDHCGDDQYCMQVDEELAICIGSCSRNQDCDGGNVCQIGLDTEGSIQTVCDHPVGDAEIGDECQESSECESALCLTSYSSYGISCEFDEQCPGSAECICPLNDPDCTQKDCIELESRCSEFCDPENGDADCETGDHPMQHCDEQVQFQLESTVETIPACALVYEE